jgi:hypothetical protein
MHHDHFGGVFAVKDEKGTWNLICAIQCKPACCYRYSYRSFTPPYEATSLIFLLKVA